MDTHSPQIDELEVKLAFQERRIEELHEALVDKERRIGALEASVERLERALTILAGRLRSPSPDVAGAMDVDDPVPRSG